MHDLVAFLQSFKLGCRQAEAEVWKKEDINEALGPAGDPGSNQLSKETAKDVFKNSAEDRASKITKE